MAQIFDLSSVGFIKRIVIGSSTPNEIHDENKVKADMDFLNQFLTNFPKGKIIACEKNFNILNIGEHQVVQQWVVYHVGFTKKPLWMKD